MIGFCISMHIHCMSNHSSVCLPITLSVCPSFCPSVYPSVHPYVCSHIAKSIETLSKINFKSMVQFYMETNHPWNEKNIEKKIALKSRIVVCTNLFGLIVQKQDILDFLKSNMSRRWKILFTEVVSIFW